MHTNITDIEKFLRRIDYNIRIEGRKIIGELDITVPQFTALQTLIHNGSMTIGQLSQKMALACSTITDLIDRMEKSELVIRKKDENDKRIVIVEVLPKGYDILEKVLEKRRNYLMIQLHQFDKSELETFNKLLEKLYRSIVD